MFQTPLLSTIYNSIYVMYDILKTDPKPHLIPGKLQGSLHTEYYIRGGTVRKQSCFIRNMHNVSISCFVNVIPGKALPHT